MTRQWSRTVFSTPSILIRFSHLTSGFFETHSQVRNGRYATTKKNHVENKQGRKITGGI